MAMKLIARKPCSFGGQKFFIGDEIPAELVLKPSEQEKMGVIAMVGDAPSTEAVMPKPISGVAVLIHPEDGDMLLTITPDGLQDVVDVLTSNASEAEPIIEKMTDGDALILLHVVDSRKTVKVAAEERAQKISQESAGEQ